MEYVALLGFRSSASTNDKDAALARRASWSYPAGSKLIAEYWPACGDVAVVSIFSADSFEPIMALMLEWGDAFEIDVYPAVSHDAGLKMGSALMASLPRTT